MIARIRNRPRLRALSPCCRTWYSGYHTGSRTRVRKSACQMIRPQRWHRHPKRVHSYLIACALRPVADLGGQPFDHFLMASGVEEACRFMRSAPPVKQPVLVAIGRFQLPAVGGDHGAGVQVLHRLWTGRPDRLGAGGTVRAMASIPLEENVVIPRGLRIDKWQRAFPRQIGGGANVQQFEQRGHAIDVHPRQWLNLARRPVRWALVTHRFYAKCHRCHISSLVPGPSRNRSEQTTARHFHDCEVIFRLC